MQSSGVRLVHRMLPWVVSKVCSGMVLLLCKLYALELWCLNLGMGCDQVLPAFYLAVCW